MLPKSKSGFSTSEEKCKSDSYLYVLSPNLNLTILINADYLLVRNNVSSKCGTGSPSSFGDTET